MLKKFIVILAISGTHFVLARIIIPLAISRLLAIAASDQSTTFVVKLLVWTTRVLYFPIISLSLYSREWFPGDLIYIPIIINSLLWAIAVCCVSLMLKKIFRT